MPIASLTLKIYILLFIEIKEDIHRIENLDYQFNFHCYIHWFSVAYSLFIFWSIGSYFFFLSFLVKDLELQHEIRIFTLQAKILNSQYKSFELFFSCCLFVHQFPDVVF